MSGTPPPAGGAPPAGPPVPTGPFIDPSKEAIQPRAVLLVAPVTAFFTLAMVCIGLRLWAKRLKKASLRFGDYAILIAALFGAGYLAICWLVADRGGVGFPLAQVAPPQRLFTQQSFIVAWLIQAWANSFVRLSILDFIGQVFSIHTKFRYTVYFYEACAVAYLAGCTITFFAICRPMKYNWTPGPEALANCGNLNMKFLLSAVFNLILDVGILILPMPMLWRLQMNTTKKIALSVVFGLGIFVCFATAWRTYHVVEFSKPESKLNFTMTVVEDALWSGLEITLGIINACLPVMTPALQRLFKTPYLRLISFSSRRSTKPSKFSTTTVNSGTSSNSVLKPSWMRLGSSSRGSRTSRSGGIVRHTELSVDIESDPGGHIQMDRMGSQTRLAADPWAYNYTATTHTHASGKPPTQEQGLPTHKDWDYNLADDRKGRGQV